MAELSVVVLAHTDVPHLTHLVRALLDLPVLLHIDSKAKQSCRVASADLPSHVRLLRSTDTRLSSWSLVAAEIQGLRAALKLSEADHIAVLTGSDYPLIPVDELVDVLRPWRGYSWIYNRPLPYSPWDTERHPDGGLWRLRHRSFTVRGNLVSVAGRPLLWPVRREVPAGVELRATTQWKIYSREHAGLLLRVVDARPDLVRFWRSSFVPEETFVASVLSSPALVGSVALQPCTARAWFYDFRGSDHPRWLDSTDFDALAEARYAPPLDPQTAFACSYSPASQHRKLFARKFSTSVDPDITSRIDAELRR